MFMALNKLGPQHEIDITLDNSLLIQAAAVSSGTNMFVTLSCMFSSYVVHQQSLLDYLDQDTFTIPVAIGGFSSTFHLWWILCHSLVDFCVACATYFLLVVNLGNILSKLSQTPLTTSSQAAISWVMLILQQRIEQWVEFWVVVVWGNALVSTSILHQFRLPPMELAVYYWVMP